MKCTYSLLTICSVILISACASVQLIAPYDATIDQDLTSLQTQTLAFLAGIPTGGGDAASSTHLQFFKNVNVALMTLETRASAISDNELTAASLNELQTQFTNLQDLDTKGQLKGGEIPLQIRAFNESFGYLLGLELGKKNLVVDPNSTSPNSASPVTTH